MTLVVFLAPIATAGYIAYGSSFYLTITALLWSVYITNTGISFQFPFLFVYNLLTMFPILLFRIALVYQITRYYQGKTTRGRTAVVAFLSESPLLVFYFLFLITAMMYGGVGLNFPLPILMILGLLLLWKFPVHEATVPWEEEDEPTYWWENVSEDEPEPAADNQPW